MSREVLNSYQAYKERVAFIEKAVGEGVLERIPIRERSQNIALVYNLNDEITVGRVGETFPKPSGRPLTRQRISQINKNFLEEALSHASPSLQSSHPLSELLTKKPHPLSETDVRIKSMFEKGTAPKEIGRTVGAKVLRRARATLGRRGVEIPLMSISYEGLKAKVEGEADDRKLQEILDSLTAISLRNHILRHNQDTERVFVSLTFVLREAGFHPHRYLAIFADKLKERDIPVRASPHTRTKDSKSEVIYWIVFDKHKQRIIDALKDDPELQRFKRNPVQLICGSPDKIPTTTDFAKRKFYKEYGGNIAGMIQDTTGYHLRRRGGLKVRDFLIGCPVPVFKYAHRHIYPLDRTEELKSFLAGRYEALQAAPNSQ